MHPLVTAQRVTIAWNVQPRPPPQMAALVTSVLAAITVNQGHRIRHHVHLERIHQMTEIRILRIVQHVTLVNGVEPTISQEHQVYYYNIVMVITTLRWSLWHNFCTPNLRYNGSWCDSQYTCHNSPVRLVNSNSDLHSRIFLLWYSREPL